MKKNILLLIAFILLSTFSVQAQGTIQPKQVVDTPKGIIYNKEFTVDFKVQTNGYAVALDFGKIQTYYRTRYYHFELGELKHPRQVRTNPQGQSRAGNISARSYVFGKQNNLYALRAGLGTKKFLTEKAKKKGVAVGLNYEFGPTLGILKPYYLDIYQNEGIDNQRTRSVKYSEETAMQFDDPSRIFGASNWTTGLGEIIPTAGAHGSFSVHFDWGAFDEYVKALDAGIMVDVFLKKTPILIDGANIDTEIIENRNVFINLFVNLQFGKRR